MTARYSTEAVIKVSPFGSRHEPHYDIEAHITLHDIKIIAPAMDGKSPRTAVVRSLAVAQVVRRARRLYRQMYGKAAP